jgi:hypothetical protein
LTQLPKFGSLMLGSLKAFVQFVPLQVLRPELLQLVPLQVVRPELVQLLEINK